MIELKTRLHEGIYRSCGGGQITVHKTWKTGPRNLLKAMQTLKKHSRQMTQAYGNVGHCVSWLEIDGQEISWDEFSELEYYTDPSNFRDSVFLSAISRTQWAKNYLSALKK